MCCNLPILPLIRFTSLVIPDSITVDYVDLVASSHSDDTSDGVILVLVDISLSTVLLIHVGTQ